MARVVLDHVEKTYPNGHRALADLSLEIHDGELLALVGPSGCGKSTLLRALAGLEAITSGEIVIGDTAVSTWTPQKRRVAMVFQDYALYPTMTVRANLEFPLLMQKTSKAERAERVERIASVLDLGGVMNRLPLQLSGGQRQRVAMGRALVREPSVFLLDEPLSNLDANLRTLVRSEIAELQKRIGTTMIYVTHDQVEAMTLGHRIAILNQGQLQQVADPRTLYRYPASPFVAGFIGNPPMNLVPSTITTGAHGHRQIYWGNQAIELGTSTSAADRFSTADRAQICWGIRPEAISIDENGTLEGMVEIVEFLGHETLLHVSPPDPWPEATRLIVRLPGMPSIQPNSPVRLAISMDEVVLFSAPTSGA